MAQCSGSRRRSREWVSGWYDVAQLGRPRALLVKRGVLYECRERDLQLALVWGHVGLLGLGLSYRLEVVLPQVDRNFGVSVVIVRVVNKGNWWQVRMVSH